jgi:hypothetical protein
MRQTAVQTAPGEPSRQSSGHAPFIILSGLPQHIVAAQHKHTHAEHEQQQR